jgi:hypothetical protein
MLITCPFPVSRLLLVFTESHHFLLDRWMAQTLTRKTIRCLLVHPLSCFCEASQLATVSTRAHQDGTQVFVILVANVFCKVSQYFRFSCVLRAGPLVAISLSTYPSAYFFADADGGPSTHCMYYVFIFFISCCLARWTQFVRVDGHIHFPHSNVDTAIGRSHLNIFSNIKSIFHLQEMFILDTAT